MKLTKRQLNRLLQLLAAFFLANFTLQSLSASVSASAGAYAGASETISERQLRSDLALSVKKSNERGQQDESLTTSTTPITNAKGTAPGAIKTKALTPSTTSATTLAIATPTTTTIRTFPLTAIASVFSTPALEEQTATATTGDGQTLAKLEKSKNPSISTIVITPATAKLSSTTATATESEIIENDDVLDVRQSSTEIFSLLSSALPSTSTSTSASTSSKPLVIQPTANQSSIDHWHWQHQEPQQKQKPWPQVTVTMARATTRIVEASRHQKRNRKQSTTQSRSEQRQSMPKSMPSPQTTPSMPSLSAALIHNVAVLMHSPILDRMQVQQGFNNFLDFFQVNLTNIHVDFIRDNDLSDFIKLLEHPKYASVVKTLDTGSNTEDDLAEGVSYQQSTKRQRNSQSTTAFIGYCNLAEELSRDYNKSVFLWPCPKMKESGNFLPSFEAISFAVKSIATKLNWTQVDIFVGDENWALPLAIAANLPVPHKIEICEDNIRDLHAQDRIGKAIIITAGMNDDSTLRILSNLKRLEYTKILLIDIVASSFNAENRFYKNLAHIETNSKLMSNLLLLTVLSDKYRHFLNVAFDDNGIGMVQNFRQLRRWKAMTGEATATKLKDPSMHVNWPIHLDTSVVDAFQYDSRTSTTATPTLKPIIISTNNHNKNNNKNNNTANDWLMHALSECSSLLSDAKIDFARICPNYKKVASNCARYMSYSSSSRSSISSTDNNNINNNKNKSNINETLSTAAADADAIKSETDIATELRSSLERLCHHRSWPMAVTTANGEEEQREIAHLRNFIDFFHFYDFLIANLLHATNSSSRGTVSRGIDEDETNKNSHAAVVPKYDFIVLDVVRTSGSSSVSPSVASGGVGVTVNRTNANDSGKYSRHNDTFKWRPLLILEQHEINSKTYITHSILPGYDDWLFVSTAQLWHCGAICWTIVAIGMGMLLIIVSASVAAGIAMRNYFLRKRLSKGPNKIVLSANDFVFPVDSRRVDEGIEAMLCCWLQQLQEFGGPEVDKPDLLKGSIGSLKNLGLIIPGVAGTTTTATAANGKSVSGSGSLARHNPALLDMRARYNGDLVQLKEIALNGNAELKSKAMDLLVMAHSLRHENINPLIGWFSDPNRSAMVFDYCSRGSLQDVLIMDEIKLDWSFRLSLLTDLVRGMRYLHASALRVHGNLTSRNCVVDARWVLKITDYGLPPFYEAQAITPPTRSAKELLWTAPELLRAMKSHQHHHHSRVFGTQMGDVYSFGIIMQEVVVRGEPYCMLSLSPEEIIAKIKKPPPLIRPSVSKGAAPPEAINIMRQCWAEQPDMRPDFNSVYERFKILNHGRKVNFVDTMFQMLEKYSNNLEELIRERTEQLDQERKKTEQLLNRMLPSSVAEKLKMGLAVDPEEFSDVTIYFSDIVGFTTIAAHCSPVQVVDFLNDLYTIFDATINAYNVYKVETIGDAYMVVSGLPVKIPDHAEQIATMALDLLHQSGRFNVKHLPGVPLQLRIGLHTGPCCAGVVGLTMPRYCLFGDTVNTASRMESSGSSWRIHMSQETRDRLEAVGGYLIEPRGLIEVKGKGLMNTFWLLGKKGFEKPLPTPPPIGESHGLDESLIRNSITLKAQANKSRNSTNPSSSQSSSLAGESVEVKVEITPPANAEVISTVQPNSYSLDSTSTNTISPNTTLCPEFPVKTPNASPQARKMSELAPENLLNPNAFNRLPSTTSASSSRLYKKIEEMMDLSLPYNHYKCLSPSESNLTQFYDGKYLYSSTNATSGGAGGVGGVGGGGGGGSSSGGGSVHSSSVKFDSKPGSSRLLRRQFSLDRDDTHTKPDHHHQQQHQSSLQASHNMLMLTTKASMLDIPILHDTSRSPKNTLTRAHRQNSSSITQDLEKIEEIPISPASSQHHSSLDSNLNRSPPSTIDTQSPPLAAAALDGPLPPPPPSQSPPPPASQSATVAVAEIVVTPPALQSAPTSPAPSRSLNGGIAGHVCCAIADGGGGGPMDNSPATDISATTTTTSVHSSSTTPGEESSGQGTGTASQTTAPAIRQPELTLNVDALLSR